MGLSRFFEYCNEKIGLIFDLGLRDIFDLLHSLGHILHKPRRACRCISYQRLELVCDDGAYDHLVLDEPKVGRPKPGVGKHG